ncbi:aromatic hydroxylase fmpF [Physcia stellaris]|nr:aromatic hydroxylase fmpF [Physcia stellaris]
MYCSVSLTVALAASCALAIPAPIQPRADSNGTSEHSHSTTAWNAGATTEFVIHESCNASEVIQLRKGLADAVTLAEHAKEHILRFGNSSAHYQKYFGDAPSGEAIGYYEKVVSGDRGDALFRCDDPDGNCKQPGTSIIPSSSQNINGYLEWGAHWRGSNATNETLCAFGYTVAVSETNTYFGSDLIHRLFHMPAFGEDHVEHFAEGYAGALELARTNATFATHDSDILQYFALEVYAYDITIPGVGCPGTVPMEGATTSSMSGTPAAATPTPTVADAASATSDVPAECHTHSNGDVHCD